MGNRIDFEDIISKPVGNSYKRVQTLGIYCWQADVKTRMSAYFLPRFSLDKNRDYLEALYPGISKNKDLEGKGIYVSIWKIARIYNKVLPNSPEEILGQDYHTLSAFKAWKGFSDEDYEKGMQVYVLEEEKRFHEYKYTKVQNSTGIIYYDWDEILDRTVIDAKDDNITT